MTEIERIIREIKPSPPDEIPHFDAWLAEVSRSTTRNVLMFARRDSVDDKASMAGKASKAEPTSKPIQVPGFRNPNDPRIPAAIRLAAMRRAAQVAHRNGYADLLLRSDQWAKESPSD
jgi:hypothetical protein